MEMEGMGWDHGSHGVEEERGKDGSGMTAIMAVNDRWVVKMWKWKRKSEEELSLVVELFSTANLVGGGNAFAGTTIDKKGK